MFQKLHVAITCAEHVIAIDQSFLALTNKLCPREYYLSSGFLL